MKQSIEVIEHDEDGLETGRFYFWGKLTIQPIGDRGTITINAPGHFSVKDAGTQAAIDDEALDKPFFAHTKHGLCQCSLEATEKPVHVGDQGWWIFDGCSNRWLASGKQRAVDFLREYAPKLKPGEQVRLKIIVVDDAAIKSSKPSRGRKENGRY